MTAPIALKDDQFVELTIGPENLAGIVPAGAVFDAGSVVATLSDGTELSATVSADQTTVTVTALGPVTGPDTLTIEGSWNGQALTAATVEFDVSADNPVEVGITSVGTPQQNPAPAA